MQLRSQRRLTTSDQRKEMSVESEAWAVGSGPGVAVPVDWTQGGADQRRPRPHRAGNSKAMALVTSARTRNMAAIPSKASWPVQRLEEDWATSALVAGGSGRDTNGKIRGSQPPRDKGITRAILGGRDGRRTTGELRDQVIPSYASRLGFDRCHLPFPAMACISDPNQGHA